jgi:hypothetical protein
VSVHELEEALLRVYDMAEHRPDVREAIRAVLVRDKTVVPEEPTGDDWQAAIRSAHRLLGQVLEEAP